MPARAISIENGDALLGQISAHRTFSGRNTAGQSNDHMNLLFLAVGTVHGASSRHFRFRERFPTQWTGLPTAMIHLEVPEVIPHFSVCILVIAERCSMMAQGTLNDFLDGNGKSLPFLFGHSANPFRRPDASRKRDSSA